MADTLSLANSQTEALLETLEGRFHAHMHRHGNVLWDDVKSRIVAQPQKLWSLHEMERTGGEPDVIQIIGKGELVFYDFAPESPTGRRSLCDDPQALASRKEFKPAHSALGMAEEIGIEILDEHDYRLLQSLQVVDKKTSSWIKTPEAIRKLGGALFCDYRYGAVFVYYNGAESYYAARGFRGKLQI